MMYPLSDLYAASAHEVDPNDVGWELAADARSFYAELGDIRRADLGELWRLARDLVQAIDRWSEVWKDTSGEERMRIALDAAWQFVQQHGGTAALREVVSRYLDARLPGPLGPLTGWIVRRLLTDTTLRRVLQFVLELAVCETHASTPTTATA
jgi:hypothetical protein